MGCFGPILLQKSERRPRRSDTDAFHTTSTLQTVRDATQRSQSPQPVGDAHRAWPAGAGSGDGRERELELRATGSA